MITRLIDYMLGDYYEHLEDFVDLKIDGEWYRCKVQHLPDVEHLLSVHPIQDGKINCRFDTGLCGRDALADDVRPAAAYLHGVGAVQWPDGKQDSGLVFCWNPEIGNDGTRLFYGGFERMRQHAQPPNR